MSSIDDDKRRFEALYREHYRSVAGFVGRRLSADSVDDAVAEVFAVAWRRRTDMPKPAIGWLLGVASNVVASAYRAHARLPVLVDEARLEARCAAHDPQDAVITRLRLLEAVSKLNASDRESLLLIAWEGLSYEDAADAAGCTPGAFRVRVSRARGRLRLLMGDATSKRAEVPGEG